MRHAIIYILYAVAFFGHENSYGQDRGLMAYKSYFDNQLKGWTKSFAVFSLSSFKKEESVAFEDIEYMEIADLKDFYPIYKPALSFSPNKKKFIDIYSYWLNLDKEGKTIVSRGGEPDQAITLCDLTTKKWKRILFRGTTERIQDALWITNSRFILVAASENNRGEQNPMIYLGDTISKTIVSFASTDRRSVQKAGGYDSPKLLRLKIKEL